MKGMPVLPSSVRGGFSPLGPRWCWVRGDKHTIGIKGKARSLTQTFVGADACLLWAVLGDSVGGGGSLHKGPLFEQQLPPPGRAVGGELPHSAAAPTCSEQEEQKCQLPAAWEVSRISTPSPAEGAQGWGSGLGRWREPVCRGLAGAGLPWGLSCALGGAMVEL